jgi:hypothetical protein
MYTSKQAALPKSSWQLYSKVLRERTSPQELVWLFKPQSITKGLIKKLYIGGDLGTLGI